MTDLVSQLVGALNRLYVAAPTGLECNSFHHSKGDFHSHSEPCKPAAEYLEALAQALAALTAAKAGGWVAVPVEPHGYLYDVYFEDEDGDPAGSKRDNFTRSLKYAKANGTNVRAVCILPTPPKEQA